MNTKNQTDPLAAILAEMKRRADEAHDGLNGVADINQIDYMEVEGWAARIKAAAERERAEWRRQLRNEIQISDALATVRPQLNSVGDVMAEAAKERAHEIELAKLRTPGDAAAMRAALRNVTLVAEFCAKTPRYTPGYPTDAARADALYSRIAELGRVAHAALSAPARNCDRFATIDEARLEFQKIRGHKAWADIELWDDMDEVGAFARWLFAHAEGGDHA